MLQRCELYFTLGLRQGGTTMQQLWVLLLGAVHSLAGWRCCCLLAVQFAGRVPGAGLDAGCWHGSVWLQ